MVVLFFMAHAAGILVDSIVYRNDFMNQKPVSCKQVGLVEDYNDHSKVSHPLLNLTFSLQTHR